MIAPCVGVLRDLARTMRDLLGSDIGTRHAPSNLATDIATLMESLVDHDVYKDKGHRFAEGDGLPVPDVVAVGFQHLTAGTKNPLDEYNLAFTHLQARRRLRPLVGDFHSVESQQAPITSATVQLEQDTDIDMERDNEQVHTVSDAMVASIDESDDLDDFWRMILDDEPTLTLDSAADVALDMDSGDNGFIFCDSGDEGEDEDEPEVADPDVD